MKRLIFLLIASTMIVSCQNWNLQNKDNSTTLPITINFGEIELTGSKIIYAKDNVTIKMKEVFPDEQDSDGIWIFSKMVIDLSKLTHVKKITILGHEDCDANSTKLLVYKRNGLLMHSDSNKEGADDYKFEINAGKNSIKYLKISSCEGMIKKLIIE